MESITQGIPLVTKDTPNDVSQARITNNFFFICNEKYILHERKQAHINGLYEKQQKEKRASPLTYRIRHCVGEVQTHDKTPHGLAKTKA